MLSLSLYRSIGILLIHFKEQDKESASSEEVTKAKDALVAGQAAAKESS